MCPSRLNQVKIRGQEDHDTSHHDRTEGTEIQVTPEHLKQEIPTTCISHYYSGRQSEKYGDYGKRPQNNQFSSTALQLTH